MINFRPRERFKYRSWAYRAASGTTGGACGYLILLSFWPEFFLHWLTGLIVSLAVLVSNGVAFSFYAQKVRQQREQQRREREWRQAQAALRRHARAQENVRLREAMDAPTQVLRILPPVVPEPTTYGMEDRLRMRLWTNLTEHTGDLGEPLRGEGPTPPHGWQSGVA